MDDAVPPGTGGMLSVIGLTMDQLETAIAREPNVSIANHLSETQMVLGGLKEDLSALKPELEARGPKWLRCWRSKALRTVRCSIPPPCASPRS
jgi:malonyl CoA-acyl carrier protein transacylase